MNRRDIISVCVNILLVACIGLIWMQGKENEEIFQKTIDTQQEMLYNKNIQIEEMEKIMAIQESNLRDICEELEASKQRQARIIDIRVTHYSADETGSSMTSSGRNAIVGRTVACNFLPLGTHVVINGHEYIVEDRGGMVGNVVDIFVDNAVEAMNLGTYYTTMEVIE